MRKCGFFFSILLYLLTVMCNAPLDCEHDRFQFVTVNVGQGLSQIGVYNGKSIVWDVGPPEGFAEWLNAYDKTGHPKINAILLSHSDQDHAGALSMIDSTIDWSGVLIINSYEDTALILKKLVKWNKPVEIRIIGQGDTLLLEEVNISCLWPPKGLAYNKNDDQNPHCLAFRIQHGSCSVLISSDLDSSSLGSISQFYGGALRSDILIVPHHGSNKSYNYQFFGDVSPEYAVISYGENLYGHPSPQILSLLFSVHCELLFTAVSGTCYFWSNNFYWVL